MTRRRLRDLALALVLPVSACELPEVAAPGSEDLLVVEAVLRVGAPRQTVLLHRGIDAGRVGGAPGASVTVTGPSGEVLEFTEAHVSSCVLGTAPAGESDLEMEFTCYQSQPSRARFVQPGTQYSLRIETASGEVVEGRTQVPSAPAFRIPNVAVDGADRIAFCTLPSHPFTLTWSRSEEAWSYLVTAEIGGWGDDLREEGIEVPDPLELTGVAVSNRDTTIAFPEQLGLFQRARYDQRIFAALRTGLPEGATTTLMVLAADANYTNAVRGGRFNPSGNVRHSSVVGDGVGIFGSVVPLEIRSNSDPRRMEPCPMPTEVASLRNHTSEETRRLFDREDD